MDKALCLTLTIFFLLGLSAEGPPQWRKKMIAKFIARTPGNKVFFMCSAVGSPAPNITWLKNNMVFQNRSHGQTILRRWMLKLKDLVLDDDGNYTCIIQNKYGEIRWTYHLHVGPPHPPIIYKEPRNLTVVVGSTATFECRIHNSDAQPHIQWLKHFTRNGSYVKDNGTPYITVVKTSDLKTVDPDILVLENVTDDDAGWYTCLQGNSIGISRRSAWLTVVPVPLAGNSDDWHQYNSAGRNGSGVGGIIMGLALELLVVLCKYDRV